MCPFLLTSAYNVGMMRFELFKIHAFDQDRLVESGMRRACSKRAPVVGLLRAKTKMLRRNAVYQVVTIAYGRLFPAPTGRAAARTWRAVPTRKSTRSALRSRVSSSTWNQSDTTAPPASLPWSTTVPWFACADEAFQPLTLGQLGCPATELEDNRTDVMCQNCMFKLDHHRPGGHSYNWVIHSFNGRFVPGGINAAINRSPFDATLAF